MNNWRAEMKGNIAVWLCSHCKISIPEKFRSCHEKFLVSHRFMIDEKISLACLGLFSASSDESAEMLQLYSRRSLPYD